MRVWIRVRIQVQIWVGFRFCWVQVWLRVWVTEAAHLSKVIVAVILERRGGAGEQHVDKSKEEGGHKLHNGAWRYQHREANKDQLFPRLDQLPPKVSGLIILTEQHMHGISWWPQSVLRGRVQSCGQYSYEKAERLAELCGTLVA